MNEFQRAEYEHHARYFRSLQGVRAGYQGHDVMLHPDDVHANFDPVHADAIRDFFRYSDDEGAQEIGWHTRSNHGASSQACCVNFLFPMARDPALLSRWVDHVMGIEGVEVQPIDRRCAEDWYLTFEWFPAVDYLNEANSRGARTRGANSTSVDAALRYVHEGKSNLLLVEWKYTEAYGSKRTASHERGDETRERRYANLWRRPHGPVRIDAPVRLSDFFLDPWYQLLRQQMLAYHCEVDPLGDFDRVTVLHVSPSDNTGLKEAKGKLREKTGTANVFEAFVGLLEPAFRDRFRAISTETAFALPAFAKRCDSHAWLQSRYPSLLP